MSGLPSPLTVRVEAHDVAGEIVRILDASESLGCIGVALDALDVDAERFYLKYQFVTVEASTWPHKMFLPLATARALFL